MKIIIFGAGKIADRYFVSLVSNKAFSECPEVVCFLDNNQHKQKTLLHGLPIKAPEEALGLDYDKIIITITDVEEALQQLLQLGVAQDKIEAIPNTKIETRALWLQDYAALVRKRDIAGNVAEVGVFRGEFAKLLNLHFFDKKLYLFDSFEGFAASDIEKEQKTSIAQAGHYDNTSVEIVLQKMRNPQNCIIHKGFFPESAQDVCDIFCFVNLDVDLYQPTFEGLRFFWPQLSPGAAILIHDFYSEEYPNVAQAVFDFEKTLGQPLLLIPIGDTLSIAVIKPFL